MFSLVSFLIISGAFGLIQGQFKGSCLMSLLKFVLGFLQEVLFYGASKVDVFLDLLDTFGLIVKGSS